jgi:hypothetical protein
VTTSRIRKKSGKYLQELEKSGKYWQESEKIWQVLARIIIIWRVLARIRKNLEPFDGTSLPESENKENYCGYEQTDGFIVGGEIAKQGSYPFLALVGKKSRKNAKRD